MRIVHILKGKANPETPNGVNKVVHWMATSLARQGHKVEVWGLAESMTPPPQEHEYLLRLFPLTRLRVTLERRIKAAVKGLEPGAWVQFHSVFIPEFPTIARLLKRRGFAYGITPHNGYASGVFKKSPWKKRFYTAFREAEYLRTAAWIQAIGESEIADILRIAPKARIALIPSGQEPLAAHSGVLPAGVRRPLIGFCGRLHRQSKGLDFLIEGFATYKANGGTGELWLIGDGEDRSWLERQADGSSARAQVRFLGAKQGEEKLNLIAGFDVFIHSSRWEGLPMACLEAAALGVPLVVSRETNLAGYVEQSGAGLVLDETSAAGVARALDRAGRLYTENRLLPMGQNARSLVDDVFNWEKNASSFVAAIADSGHALQ